MAAKIFFLAIVALLTIQGLNASSLSKRNILDDLKSKVQNLTDAAAKLTEAAEEKAKAAVQEALDNLNKIIADAKAVVENAVAQIKEKVKEIADKAKEVVENAVKELSDLKDKAEAKIASYIEELKTYGEAAVSCGYSKWGNITSVVGSAGSRVISCTTAVAQKADPIARDAFETAAKLVDLGVKAVTIVTTCIPAGATFVLAAPCVLVQTALVGKAVVEDVIVITGDVSDIIKNAPALKQEIESCSAEVQSAKSDVDSLVGEIRKCVDDYRSSAA